MASSRKDELSDQETDDDSRSDAPQSTTMKLKRSREVKVDDHHCQPDSQVKRYRQSSCSDDEAVDNAGRTPVQSAVESVSPNVMVTLGSRLPAEVINTPKAMCRTALHIAAKEDRVDDVRRLLDCGADVVALDEEGRSPLVTALVHRSWNSARAILDHRSDVVASSGMHVVDDMQGWTVLHSLCAWATPVNIFRRVLDGGVAANVRDFYGNTPLHTIRQCPEFIQLLIEYGADVNAQNDHGQTPLHVAFSCGNVKVARCLIQAGADLNVRDDFYNTPFHCDSSDTGVFYNHCGRYYEWKRLIPDLPQSAVQSDTLNMFGVPTVFKFMALDDSPQQLARVYRRNFTSFHTAKYKDNKCKHLLPLHREAAVNTRNAFGQT